MVFRLRGNAVAPGNLADLHASIVFSVVGNQPFDDAPKFLAHFTVTLARSALLVFCGRRARPVALFFRCNGSFFYSQRGCFFQRNKRRVPNRFAGEDRLTLALFFKRFLGKNAGKLRQGHRLFSRVNHCFNLCFQAHAKSAFLDSTEAGAVS